MAQRIQLYRALCRRGFPPFSRLGEDHFKPTDQEIAASREMRNGALGGHTVNFGDTSRSFYDVRATLHQRIEANTSHVSG